MIPSSFAKGRGIMHCHCAKPFYGIGLFSFCLILLLLAGCATLNKEECLNADWYSIGYVDGARGYPASKIGEHRQACAEYSVKPEFDQYDKGRIAGLVEYCNPRNGYWLGTKGALYSGVCPKNLKGPFIAAYQHGKNVYAPPSLPSPLPPPSPPSLPSPPLLPPSLLQNGTQIHCRLDSNGFYRHRKRRLASIRLRETDERAVGSSGVFADGGGSILLLYINSGQNVAA